MADVRLTATNPENSEAVPVACNAKGELLLEAPADVDGVVLLDDGGTKQVIKSAGLGISDGSDENISLNANGTANFEGRVDAPEYLGVGSTANDKIWSGYLANTNGTATSAINADGSSYFSNSVGVGTNNPQRLLQVGEYGVTGGEIALAGSQSGITSILMGYGTSGAELYQGYIQYNFSSNQMLFATSAATCFKLNGDSSAEFTSDVIVGSRGRQWMIVESNGLAHLVEQTFRDRFNNKRQPRETNYPELRNIPGELTMIEEQLQKVMEFLKMVPEAGWEVWDGAD